MALGYVPVEAVIFVVWALAVAPTLAFALAALTGFRASHPVAAISPGTTLVLVTLARD